MTLLDNFPPESISNATTTLLLETVAAAVENWNEGFWADFDQNINKADVLRYFAGYIDALLDGDPEEYTEPLLAPTYDQHLVDYSVRNLTTGDEEELRLLELTDDEVAGFPDAIRDEVQSYLAVGAEAMGGGRPRMDWDDAQDALLQVLMPYITDRELYDNDYQAWEQRLLGNEETD